MMPWDEPVDISNEEGKTPIQAFPKGNKMGASIRIMVPVREQRGVIIHPSLCHKEARWGTFSSEMSL